MVSGLAEYAGRNLEYAGRSDQGGSRMFFRVRWAYHMDTGRTPNRPERYFRVLDPI